MVTIGLEGLACLCKLFLCLIGLPGLIFLILYTIGKGYKNLKHWYDYHTMKIAIDTTIFDKEDISYLDFTILLYYILGGTGMGEILPY